MSKIQYFSLLALFILAFNIAACNQNKPTNTPNPSAQVDQSEKIDHSDFANETISIKNISKWEKKENHFGTLVTFLAEPENKDDTFKENFSLTTETVSSDINLEEYVTEAQANMEKIFAKVSIIENKLIDFNGYEAYQHVYNFKQPNIVDARAMQIFFLNNETAYILTYTAEKPKYDKYIDEVTAMMKTLEIK